VLTMERPSVEAPADDVAGYWCQWVGVDPATGGVHSLGGAATLTPRLAMRWAQRRAQEIATQLTPPASWVIFGWAQDLAELERALRQLAVGIEYTREFYEEGDRYVLSVRPVTDDQPTAQIGGQW